MPLTQTQQDIQLQKIVILATGSAANSSQMAQMNALVSPSGSMVSLDLIVDSYINQLVAKQGSVVTYQAIAKNGFGVTLTDAQAQAIINDFAAAGINTGSKLLNLLSNVQNANSATLDNRAEAASSFLEMLSDGAKSANFTGEGVTSAVRTLLQNIGTSQASLDNGLSGLNALTNNMTDFLSGDPSNTKITGIVGSYLANATVFADTNRDGQLNAGEWTTKTGANGAFALPNTAVDGKIVAYGGIDLMTGNAYQGVISSSTGSTVINPLTTLVEAMVASGGASTVLDATTAIKAVLGLPTTINLLSYNPLTVLASSTATAAEKAIALSVQKTSQQISNIITQAASVIDNGTSNATIQTAGAAVALAIVQAITLSAATGGTLNLSNAATLGSIIQVASTATGSTFTAAQIAQVAQITAGSNASAAAATSFTLLAQAGDVAQGGATNALIAGAISGNFNSAVGSFTGTALTDANYAVTVGSIIPGVPIPQTAAQIAAATPPGPPPVVAPSAPTGVTLTAVGGTVVANALNTTNTNLTATATIIPGQATGGSAVLKIGATTIATDATILAGDTTVTFNLSTANNAALQAAVAAGGVATVTLTNAGGSAVSAVGNPTLTVNYTTSSINLTVVGAENLAGTGGDDTFNGLLINGGGANTFDASDILDGLGGVDKLSINSGLTNGAQSIGDALFVGKTNFEQALFDVTGNGAQDITGGANLSAAFPNGINLTAKTLLGAIDVTLTNYTHAATITTNAIGAGAHTIVTGSGASTVNATGVAAGSQTINGVGLASVTATIGGGGDQQIGTTTGGNLVSVNATITGAGFQNITSTSSSNVTIVANAAAGSQTITTAGGNDNVTTTGGAGQTATITTGAGNDTIVAGLGTDLITAGTGADTITGGGGVDTFEFGLNGAVIGTSMDIITDFNTGGADILRFGGAVTVLPAAEGLLPLTAGSNVFTTAGGLISFHASDNTLALKTIAIQADVELDLAGTIAMFVDGGNTYVYYAGAGAGNIDDQMIQLSGIVDLVTIGVGATTTLSI